MFAHQGMEQVGMFSHAHEVQMTRRYRKDHDLMGFEADDLLSVFDSLSESDIWQYRYPDDAALTDTVLGWLRDDRARHLALVENPQELFGLVPAVRR